MINTIYSRMLILILFLFSLEAKSEVVINGTRIIFKGQDKETVVQLSNKGKNPYLLQFWLDSGNPESKPGNEKLPFMITPPVVRIDPSKGQAVRILAVNPSFPQDRESLLWFNMLEIPPKPVKLVDSGKNLLQMSFRSRLKFFYRPSGLKLSPLEAYKKIKFEVHGDKLKVVNDTPYYITFSKIEIKNDSGKNKLSEVSHFKKRMVNPMDQIDLLLSAKNSSDFHGQILSYSVINDYGGESTYTQVLSTHE